MSIYLAIPWESITDVTEAAGSTGRELLFQATSEQMIDAYSRVPRCCLEFLQFLSHSCLSHFERPFGTVFANDIFSSGILLSE